VLLKQRMMTMSQKMNRPSVDEQLKAIEAALDLAQARNLPAVISLPSVPADPRAGKGRGGAGSELAISILEQMGEKVAQLEAADEQHRQQQAVSEALHQEEREAIEVISSEVAALKKRAGRLERWLSQLPAHQPQRDTYPPNLTPTARQPQPLLLIALLGIAGLGLLLLVLFRGL